MNIRNRKGPLLGTCAFALAALLGANSEAAQTPQTVTSECTTDATGLDGVRHDCDSQPTIVTAPAGYVFIQNAVSGGETSGNGDEHACRTSWSEYVEVVQGTGITQPRTFSLQSHARSPSGHASGRGWSVCSYALLITQYK